MLHRFQLYGFLKNQRYFEPFLVLIFLEKGLGFFEIGLLLGLRDLLAGLLEIPSGAVADTFGRRRSMLTSFVAYIASFLVFGVAEGFGILALAMALYAVGDSFRTGTHKAMIFSWLRQQGREEERTRVYGLTRSWSKLGSAVSSLAAMGIVLVGQSYTWTFYAAVIPYVLGLVNFLGYPASLEGERPQRASLGTMVRELGRSLSLTVRHGGLRRLVLESMGFEGVFRASKDYLQPLLAGVAMLWVPTLLGLEVGGLPEASQAALVVGPVYFGLFLLSSVASRRAHRLGERLGSHTRAAWWHWVAAFVLYGTLVPALALGLDLVAMGAFVGLFALQNLWRPVLIGRFDEHTPEERGATVLSVESQAKNAAGAVLAPVVGLAVDLVSGAHPALWPVGVAGVVVALIFVLWGLAPSQGDPGDSA